MTALGARVKFRDIQVAEDVGKRAELGWLDVEFIMYGSAFYEKKEDQMYYIVSSQAKDVYAFLKKSNLQDIYPSIVDKLTLKCPVPLGTKEWIAEEIKKELANQLRDMYPKEVFQILYHYDRKNNIAAKKLWDIADKIEGLFHKEQLNIFQIMIEYAYEHHLLSLEELDKLMEWLRKEKMNSCDISRLREKDLKIMYGMILQKQDASEVVVVDAKIENVAQKMIEVEQKGYIVSPIFERAFELDHMSTPTKLRKIFQQELQSTISIKWWEELFIRQKSEMKMLQEDFLEDLKEIEGKFGEKASTTMRWYGYRWGIL